jgi:Fic family protein
MSQPKPSATPRSSLDAIRGRAASMHLPATRGLERRNVAQRQALVQRLVSEFDEMPGLRLTLAQASRLFGLSEAAALRILTDLTNRGTLQRSATDFYMRRDRG